MTDVLSKRLLYCFVRHIIRRHKANLSETSYSVHLAIKGILGMFCRGTTPAPDGPSLQKDWRQYRKPNRKRQVPHRNPCQPTAHSHHHGSACRALADEPAFHRRRGGGRGREAFTETQINALASLMADEMLVQRRICLNEERPGNLDGYRASALSAKNRAVWLSPSHP